MSQAGDEIAAAGNGQTIDRVHSLAGWPSTPSVEVPKCVKMSTKTIISAVPKQNTRSLPNESAALPTPHPVLRHRLMQQGS